MIKIEFPANNTALAGHIGRALCEYAGATTVIKLSIEGDGKQAEAQEVDYHENPDANTSHIEATIPVSQGGTMLAPELDSRVDENGVTFNVKFCGEAAIPFYASGKTKGQWKKLRGVAEEDYAAWYESARTAEPATTTTTQADEPVDTAGAFGGQGQATNGKPIPKDCGEFMGWVSSQQAAGHLNQIDITDAYTTLNLQVTDLFPPNDPAKIEEHVRNLYAVLGGLE